MHNDTVECKSPKNPKPSHNSITYESLLQRKKVSTHTLTGSEVKLK